MKTKCNEINSTHTVHMCVYGLLFLIACNDGGRRTLPCVSVCLAKHFNINSTFSWELTYGCKQFNSFGREKILQFLFLLFFLQKVLINVENVFIFQTMEFSKNFACIKKIVQERLEKCVERKGTTYCPHRKSLNCVRMLQNIVIRHSSPVSEPISDKRLHIIKDILNACNQIVSYTYRTSAQSYFIIK